MKLTKSKLREIIREEIQSLTENIKNARVGDYIKQNTSSKSNIVTYGKIVDELVNGSFKVASFESRDGKTTGKAKFTSTNNWFPEPKVIDKKDIPPKILQKIEKKAG